MSYHSLAECFKSELLLCQPLTITNADKYDAAFWVETPLDAPSMHRLQMIDKWEIEIRVTSLDQSWKYWVQCPCEDSTLVQAKCYEFLIPKILQMHRYFKIEIIEDEDVVIHEDDDDDVGIIRCEINGITCHFNTTENELLTYLVEKYAKKDIKTQIWEEAQRIAREMLPEDYAQIEAMVEAVTSKIVQQATKFTENQEDEFKWSLRIATGLHEEYVGKINPILFEAKNYF